MRHCYYKILGVAVRSSQEEIKRAFRILALRWHPDRNPKEPKAGERFKQILEAYETLVDPCRRGQYDKTRGFRKADRPERKGKKRARGGWCPEAAVDEILHEAFGVRRERSPAPEKRVCDLRFELQVARSSLNGGVSEEIEYERVVFCIACVGGSSRRVSGWCRVCGGSGEVLEKRSLRIFVPAGSDGGTRIRVSGGGDELWPGYGAGDLVVYVHVVEGR